MYDFNFIFAEVSFMAENMVCFGECSQPLGETVVVGGKLNVCQSDPVSG